MFFRSYLLFKILHLLGSNLAEMFVKKDKKKDLSHKVINSDIELTKHYALSQHDTNCRFICVMFLPTQLPS